MSIQTLLWTAMPNGKTVDNELKISILLSPRLDSQSSPQNLSSFSDFVDWPNTLQDSQITLHFGSTAVSLAVSQVAGQARIDQHYGPIQSELWNALLPATTIVKGFNFENMISKKILSYSATKIADRQKELYLELAKNAADQLPQIKQVADNKKWKSFIHDVDSIDRAYMENSDNLPRNVKLQFEHFKNNKNFGNLSQEQVELALFQLYHTPANVPEVQNYDKFDLEPAKKLAKWQTYKPFPLPSAAQLVQKYDFHQIVASMNQYPTLLRRMGLVIDILVSPDAFTNNSDQTLWVDVALPNQATTGVTTRQPSVSPKVHCTLTDGAFYARSSQPSGLHKVPVLQGLLNINAEHFELIQQDVDSTGHKSMNFARTITRNYPKLQRLDPTTRKERVTGAPSLKNAGLMLVQKQREQDLSQRFINSQSLNNKILSAQQNRQPSTVAPDIYAEDLVRGYRFDIWDDKTQIWRSLCRRSAIYSIQGQANINVAEEEGIVRLASTESADPQSNPELLYLHEMLLSWTGWSLCASMPGKIVDTEDNIGEKEAEVPTGIPIRSEFKVTPNSLPRLRYGRKYWVRARAVDLAANSLAPNPRDYAQEYPLQYAQAYLRFDPIKSPVLALVVPTAGQVEEPFEGESMQRLAIRTFNQSAALNLVDSSQIARRFVLSDSASIKQAEVHGMLDDATKMNASTYAMLASKDAQLNSQNILSIQPAVPDPSSPPPGETPYAVLTEGGVQPYLPDPLCTVIAARIFNHPEFSDKDIIPIPLYDDSSNWPDVRPFKIQLYEENGALPHFDVEQSSGIEQRLLKIPLPKACRATLRLSIMPDEKALSLLGIWQWLSAAQQNKLKQLALNGQHWMLTPWREIELVHAVQKPLITPVPKITVIREPGKTWAIPMFIADMSIKSTEKADYYASWHEPTLDTQQPQKNRTKTDLAFSIKITDPQNYHGEKPEHQLIKPDLIRAGSKDDEKFADKVHEFEDTRYRRIEYWLEATTRFREYMPASVLTELVNDLPQYTDKNLKVVGEKVVTWIPSSAPPPAPEVLYVVPTFEWLRSSTTTKQHSVRSAQGLRVYLAKPWNVSGYGEMLAVVLPGDAMNGLDPNDKPNSQPVKHFVTQWGNDPAWLSGFVPGVSPKQSDFPLSRTEPDSSGAWLPSFAEPTEADQPGGKFLVDNLQHPGIRSTLKTPLLDRNRKRVNVAPHDVFYDQERDLWYCDITLSPKTAYYPFVRLALARYQPVSVENQHLSNIVLSDFMTLANNRWATVTQSPNTLLRSVEVFGTSYQNSSANVESEKASPKNQVLPDGTIITIKAPEVSATTVVEVWVEKLDKKLGEDFGWAKDPSAKVSRKTNRRRISRRTSATQQAKIAKNIKRANLLFKKGQYLALQEEDLLEYVITAPTLWKGSVTLRAGADNSNIKRRIVIAEYEEYLVDSDAPYSEIPTKKGRRMVFVEHINLN